MRKFIAMAICLVLLFSNAFAQSYKQDQYPTIHLEEWQKINQSKQETPCWREIVSRASFGTKDKITIRLNNQAFRAPVSCLDSE